jgi:hypothetical protein
MKKILFFLPASKLMRISAGLFFSLFIIAAGVSAQAPPIQWQKALGGTQGDWGWWPGSIQQTTDGGYIVASSSVSNDGDVSGNHGNSDYWIVKMAATGNIQWQRCLGGSGDEWATSIQQTTDGGYIVAGWSHSNDGDVSGNHGGIGIPDYWIVKLDATGNIQWQRCLGGSLDEFAYSIEQTTDGGYIVAGGTSSDDGDVSGNHVNLDQSVFDYWIVKLDAIGNIQWQRCLGGSDNEWSGTSGLFSEYSIEQTTDGGYIVAGSASSNDGDVSGNHGGYDYWIVKLDVTGNIQWQRCLGGSFHDFVRSIEQTTDGGYIVAGEDQFGVSWILKLDAIGNIQWQQSLDVIFVSSIEQTTDGGYIVAGTSYSNNGNVYCNHVGYNYRLVKLDATGNIQWQQCLGGSGDDGAGSIEQTTDGGYIVAGTSSSNDGDVSGNHGASDYWIVKLGFDPLPIKLTDITARNQGNVNIVNWETASEDPRESFELERSSDAIRFEKITSIAGKGRAADYEYTDAKPLEGFNYYRLRLIHNTGTPTYSKIVRAFVKTDIELRVYPNPADDVLYVQLPPGGNGKAIFFITDAAGKTVMKSNISNTNQTVVDISKLPAGIYALRYQDGERNIIKTFIVN